MAQNPFNSGTMEIRKMEQKAAKCPNSDCLD